MNKLWIRYRRLLFVILLFLFPAVTLLLGRFPLPRLNLYDRLSAWIVHPIAEGTGNLSGGVGVVFHRYVALVGTAIENETVKKENAALKAQILSIEENEKENLRLKKLLSFAAAPSYKKIGAKIIGEDSAFESISFVINAGSAEGVKARQPVVTSDGVAGTITKVFAHSATFSAIIDPAHDVDGTISRSRARFIVEGHGPTLVGRLKYLDRAEDIRVGDLVVSSGLDGVFPAGLRIGNIVKVNRPRMGVSQTAELRSAIDFGRIEEVMVLESVIEERVPLKESLPLPDLKGDPQS